jgi:general secretion pathway protein H
MRLPRGFTLIELLVVIVLAGILISLVSISTAPDPRQQLAREAERVGQLLATAADESRIRHVPIVWEADLRGFRFYLEGGGERQLIVGDDLLRERRWEQPLTRLAILEPGRADSTRVLLSAQAPPLRLPLAREWVQAPRRVELTQDNAQVALDLDEFGRGTVVLR